MAALTDLQRRYVLAMLSDPLGSSTRWARQAGYSARSEGSLRVCAHYLAHDDRLKEAAQEEARRHLDTIGPVLGIAVMMQIARSKGHKDQLRAAEALTSRVAGFAESSEHNLTVTHTDQTGAAMVERIKALAAALGVDAAQLLGANVQPAAVLPKVIEGKVADEGT